MTGSLLRVDRLVLRAGGRAVVDGVGLTVDAAETVGLVGPSGSGKTSIALAALGHCREGVAHAGGTVQVDGHPMLPVPPPGVRGTVVGYLGQDPGSALNPFRTVGAALASVYGVRRASAPPVAAALERVGLAASLARCYPHQLSGGQQQRVALAIVLARRPRLLVLDEPTSGLDPLAAAEVTAELLRLRTSGTALLWVGHDLTTISDAADRVLVLADGRLVEEGPPGTVLTRPQSTTARALVDAGRPAAALRLAHTHGATRAHSHPDSRGIAATGLTAGYPGGPPVLRDVDLQVGPGECLAVLGVSGAGKTTLARCLAGLHPPSAGAVALDGHELAADVRRRSRAERAAVQLVAQQPAEALHPRQTLHTALARPLRLLRGITGTAARAEVGRLLDAVGLDPDRAGALPAELSGGQRQRAALARALAAGPRVLVCDEVTSALDTVTQAAVLDLLGRLRTELGLALVLITHDAGVAARAADRVLVLSDGRVAVDGPVSAVLPPPDPAAALVRRLRGDVAGDQANVG